MLLQDQVQLLLHGHAIILLELNSNTSQFKLTIATEKDSLSKVRHRSIKIEASPKPIIPIKQTKTK